MNELNDEFIEAAFTKIRANFEQRGNDDGLEILDSYEERWHGTGSLSPRQIGWLERQLDGSWRKTVNKTTEPDLDCKPQAPTIDVLPPASPVDRDLGETVDAMVREKLCDLGKVVVDHGQLDKLEALAVQLRRVIGSLK